MTYKECEIKAEEIRGKDPSAGTERKRILFLPTVYDNEKYTCITRFHKMNQSNEKSIFLCDCENDDLSLFFYDDETDELTKVL